MALSTTKQWGIIKHASGHHPVMCSHCELQCGCYSLQQWAGAGDWSKLDHDISTTHVTRDNANGCCSVQHSLQMIYICKFITSSSWCIISPDNSVDLQHIQLHIICDIHRMNHMTVMLQWWGGQATAWGQCFGCPRVLHIVGWAARRKSGI